jgi:Glycosyl-hydrolase family 116, catalytic region
MEHSFASVLACHILPFVLLGSFGILTVSPGVKAQTDLAQVTPAVTIPRFELPHSGLTWEGVAQPLQYFDATGQRAGILGRQDGRLEAWVYPIKLLHDFRLEFQQEGMLEAVRGESYLQQVITRPESTTLVYVHPLFTVRQIVWVPRNEAAAVMFFDVDSDKPITITAKFVPDFKPMWPASLGGQSSFWMEEDHALGLTDGTGVPTAMIGSPVVGAYTEYVDIALINGEMALQLRATTEQARTQFLPLVMSLSMENAAKARDIYHRVLRRARELYEERVSYHRDFLARTMQIETPDPELNRALAWAKVALDAGWVCNPTYGCGLVAGYGPAGNGERPGFDWWFGGDALMSSWALEDYGDLPGALQALRFLKARQRADGKMLHEMTQSVGLIDWFGKYRYAYYHADTTPFYLYSLEQYWSRTGDRKFLEEFLDSVKKAYAYCITTLDANDGLMDNTKAGLAAIEGGVLRGKVVKDIYLEGAWIAALEATEKMATAAGDAQFARDARSRLKKARESVEKDWWNAHDSFFAFGQTIDGRRDDMVGAWSSVLLALSSQIQSDEAAGDIAKLASPELATDWGERTTSNKSPYYDPVSYNNGTAWPFMNIFVSWAEYAHGNPLAGFTTWSEGARLTGIQSPGYMPEHMNGDRYLPGERSVPHQLFSSVGVVVPAVRGLLGLQTSGGADTDSGNQRLIRFHPQLPANWSFLRFSGYLVGNAGVSGEVRQELGRTVVRLHSNGTHPVPVEVGAPIPLLAKVRSVMVNGKAGHFLQKQLGGVNSVDVQLALERDAEVSVEYEGGVGIVPPCVKPAAGDRNASLKIMRVNAIDQSTLEMVIAGLGRSNVLDLITTLPKLTSEGADLEKTEEGYRLTIPIEGREYVTRVVRVTVNPN